MPDSDWSGHTPDETPLNAASDLHIALVSCEPIEKKSVAEKLAESLLKDDQKNGMRADALCHLIR